MTIFDRIKKLRLSQKLTQTELAIKVGYKSKSTIARIEQGDRDISRDKIIDFANALGVTPSYLMGWEDNKPQKTVERMPSEWVRIPVLGEIAAGVPIDAVELFDEDDWEEIPLEWTKNGDDFFALRIKGDSMEPRIFSKDVVIVKKQSCIETGEIAVVLVGGDTATTKKIKKEENGIFLISNNLKYPPKFYSNSDVENLPVLILGKVVELRGKF